MQGYVWWESKEELGNTEIFSKEIPIYVGGSKKGNKNKNKEKQTTMREDIIIILLL